MRFLKTILFLLFCQCCFAQHWQALGAGLDWSATRFFTDTIDDKLYIGGPFQKVDGDTMWGMTQWNGNNFDSLGHGIDRHTNSFYPGNTYAMTHLGNYLYIAGNFNWTGYAPSKSLARWDGTNWSTIPAGQPNDVVRDVISYNNELYISGVFDTVGNVPADGIARWDGTAWHSIGPNYPFSANTGIPSKMCFYNGNLYLAGVFEDPQHLHCSLAKWDGTNWQFMCYNNVEIWDMVVYNNELYVSGLFYAASGNAGNCIMKWNDTTWTDVGGGVDFYSFSQPQVRDMVIHNGKIYCAGSFEKIGGVFAFGLASWDGTNWCGYNTSFQTNSQDAGTFNLEFYHDTLYVGGDFRLADNDSACHIAKWIGGNYVDQCGNTTAINENKNEIRISIFPNPGNGEFILNGDFPADSRIEMCDMLGDKLSSEEIPQGTQNLILKYDFSPGIYLFKIVSCGRELKTGKLVISE